MELKNHQKECIDKIDENFIKNKKGLIKMFCGSGKSLIIYHSLLKYGKNLGIIVVPSINLITQFNNDYIINPLTIKFNDKYFKKKFSLMTICSKDELEQKDDINKNFITTDKHDINTFINIKNNKIILVTYQSLHNLIHIIKNNNIMIDLLCFDEAHHILGENIRKILFLEKENDTDENQYYGNFIDNHVNKTLFFTATPKNIKDYKMYHKLNEITINNIDYEIIDNENIDTKNIDTKNIDTENINTENIHNNDTPICGPIIYEYSHLCGVSDNILNDFNIRIELYSDNTTSTIFETISRAIIETGNNRVLTFHSRSLIKSNLSSDVVSFSNKENQTIFKSTFKKILSEEFPTFTEKYQKISFKGITGQTKNKSKILNEFDNTKDNEIFILSSCKTIGEGIDTKNANMVCFIDPKQSYIEIIQNIGRICRKNINTNKISTVLIPSYVDINKYKACDNTDKINNIICNEISSNGDFNSILSILSALRQEDPYIFELCLKYPDTYTINEFKRQFKRFNLLLDDIEYTIEDLFTTYNKKYDNNIDISENFKQLSEHMNKNIKIFCKKIDENNIYIDNKYNFDELFIKTENNKYIKVLGEKTKNEHITRPNRNIKPSVHTDDKIKVLWSLDKNINLDLEKKIFGCFIKSTVIANTKELWLEIYNNIINDNECNMYKYYSWIAVNKRKYKQNNGLLSDPELRKLWENIKNHETKGEFFYSNEDIWFNKLKKYKEEYLSSNQKSLFYHNEWIRLNVYNYRHNKSLMLNENIKKEWLLFMNNPIYYDIFKTYIYTSEYNINNWKHYLNLVITCDKILDKINLKNKSQYDDNLSINERNAFWLINNAQKWIENNNYLFDLKKEIMLSDEIYDLWYKNKNSQNLYLIYTSEHNINIWKHRLHVFITCNKIHNINTDNINLLLNKNSSLKIEDFNWFLNNAQKWIENNNHLFDLKEGIMLSDEIYDLWSKNRLNSNKKDTINLLEIPSQLIKKNNKMMFKVVDVEQTKIEENVKMCITKKKLGNIVKGCLSKIIKDENILKDLNNRNILELSTIDGLKKYIETWGLEIDIISNSFLLRRPRNEIVYSGEKKKIFIENKRRKGFMESITCSSMKIYTDIQIVYLNKVSNPTATIIYDKFNKHFDIIKDNKIELDDDVYISFHGIIKNNKLILSNNEININNDSIPPIPINKLIKKPVEYSILEQLMLDYDKLMKSIIDYDKKKLRNIELIEKPVKKSINIVINENITNETDKEKKKRIISEYQELSKKMVIQKSETTFNMFKTEPTLWEQYHEARDFSFKGYDQDEVPVNRIIKYLETKKNHRLKILDLGCGRNYIKEYFKDNKKFTITGYDYISCNGSKVADISNLEDEEEETIDVCIYSQSLMGNNWKGYLDEGKRILRYNGEIIISESSERYENIKNYLTELDMKIINEDYDKNKRWFYINVIKQ